MNLKELSQYYHLRLELSENAERLCRLEEKARGPGASIGGLPSRKGGGSSAMETYAVEIADLRARLCETQRRLLLERARLEEWIATIPDSHTRRIFRFRFVDCLTWTAVAMRMGGGNTEAGVRMTCRRYLRERNRREEALAGEKKS